MYALEISELIDKIILNSEVYYMIIHIFFEPLKYRLKY